MLDLWQPREVRWLAAKAAMVVSTRYHPLVFATAAGIAPLGIYVDTYTRTKLRGALAPSGLENYCISVTDAERGMLLPLAMELWHQRKVVQCRLARMLAEAWPQELSRREGICRSLDLQATAQIEVGPPAIRCSAPACDKRGEKSVPDSLGEEQWGQYEKQGYLRLGKVLNESQLMALRQRMDAIMLGEVRYPTLQMQLDTGGAYEDLPEPVAGLTESTLADRKVQGLEADPLVLDLVRQDLFREICGRSYGKHTSISIFRVMLMNKPSGKGTYLPWHQDAGDVWKLDRDPLVTVWIALDPATRMNGCLQVIPGSHRLGVISKHGSTLSPEHARIYCPDEAVTYLEVEAGEAILLHNWLLHRSDVNHTDKPWRALSACYMDGRTLSTLSGARFPLAFGEHEEAEAALPFLRSLKEESKRLRETAAEAQRYAESLIEENLNRARLCLEAERYAKSLEAELARLRTVLASSSA